MHDGRASASATVDSARKKKFIYIYIYIELQDIFVKKHLSLDLLIGYSITTK